MKKIKLLTKSLFLMPTAPLEISKCQRRRNLVQAKKTLKSANLF
ncbi:hypothetical protein N9X55_00020 [Flavobacteriaceae bacterium]|nr:hypothetical protein [Flavobacteriaceae bacterium]